MAKSNIKAGKAYVELLLRNKLAGGLRKAQAQLNSFGAGAARLGGKMLGIGAAIGGAFIPAIKAASDMEEVMNKFNVVFGNSATAVKQWGDEFGQQVGRSKKQIADFLASSQDLFVPLGFEAGAAESMSKQITALAVDLASFNNKADADVLNDLQAALTGSGEVMKKYGVLVNEAAVKQEALKLGLNPKELSDQEKVMARLSIIMNGTTAAQGDAIRSAGSWANQLKALKAEADNVAVSIGSKLLPVITPLLTKAVGIVKAISMWAEQNGDLVITIFKVAAGIAAAGVALVTFGAAVIGIGAVLGGLATIAAGMATAFGVVAGAVGLILSPLGLVVAALVGAGAAAYQFRDQIGEAVGQIAQKFAGLGGIFGKVGGYFGSVIEYIQGRFSALKAFASETFGAIAQALAAGDISAAAKVLWATLNVIWVSGTNTLKAVWAEAMNTIKDVLIGAWIGMLSAVEIVWTTLKTGWIEVTSFMSKAFAQAVGGIVMMWETVKASAQKAFNYIKALFDDDFDLKIANDKIDEALKKRKINISNDVQGSLNEIEQDRATGRSEETQRSFDRLGSLGGTYEAEQARQATERDQSTAAAESILGEAMGEWQRAVDTAKANRQASASGGGSSGDGPTVPQFDDLLKELTGGAAATAEKSQQLSSAGSFSAAALQALSGGRAKEAERTAKATEETAKLIQKQFEYWKKNAGFLVFSK